MQSHPQLLSLSSVPVAQAPLSPSCSVPAVVPAAQFQLPSPAARVFRDLSSQLAPLSREWLSVFSNITKVLTNYIPTCCRGQLYCPSNRDVVYAQTGSLVPLQAQKRVNQCFKIFEGSCLTL